jgi:hypothetical protein
MAPVVGLIYFVLLSLVLTYAVGGLGLGLAIFLLLGYMVVSELMKAKREEGDQANPTRKHMDTHSHT